MRISKKLCATACAAAVSCLLAAGSPSATAQSISEKVIKDGEITIGIHNVAPWGYVGKDGEAAGLGPDSVRAVLGPLGVKKINFVVMEWGALIPSLLAKRVDAVASGMAITEQRCKQVIFTNPDVMGLDGVIVRAGNPNNIHSYEDIAKNSSLILSSMRGTSTMERALKAGVPKSQTLEFPDTRAGIAALLAGRTVADTETYATAANIIKDPNLQGKVELATPFKGLTLPSGVQMADYSAIALRPEDKKLRDLYNDSQAKLRKDGTMKALLEKDGFANGMPPDGVTPKDIASTCM